MVSAIFGVLSTFVGWMLTHLPLSPFANLTFGNPTFAGGYTLQQVLGWVNWLIPFQGLANVFSLWLTAVIIVSVVMIVKKLTLRVGTNGVLGGESQ